MSYVILGSGKKTEIGCKYNYFHFLFEIIF